MWTEVARLTAAKAEEPLNLPPRTGGSVFYRAKLARRAAKRGFEI